MEPLIFYSYCWRKNGRNCVVYGRTDRDKTLSLVFQCPAEINSVEELWLNNNYHPCAWYRINSYVVRDGPKQINVGGNFESLELLNIMLVPTLFLIAIDDEDKDDVTIQIENSSTIRLFKFGNSNVNNPYYVSGDYKQQLSSLVSLFNVDIELYKVRKETSCVVGIKFDSWQSSFWGYLSQKCLYSNDFSKNLS